MVTGDLNIYRYVHNNPLNYTDPSGLASTAENATLRAVIGTAFLAGGTLSTAAIRDTEGAILAAEIATKSLSSVARVGAGIACKLLTVASGISIGGIPNTLCSTSNEEKSKDKTAAPRRTIPVPRKPRRGCTAICRADSNGNIPGNIKNGVPTFAFGEATRHSCQAASKAAKKIAAHKLKAQAKHTDCRTAGK